MACLDAQLYQLTDPEEPSLLCVDGITANSYVPDARLPPCKWKFTNAGFYDPSTASRVQAADILPHWSSHGKGGCTRQTLPPTAKPSPAQAALEDLTAEELAAAGTVQPGMPYPAVGRNAVMRMSRIPVFFDATAPHAPQMLAKYFYAMHKRWGGADDAPCCGTKDGPCAAAGGSGSGVPNPLDG